MHGDVGAIPRELNGDRAAEAGRRSRDEGLQAVEILLLSRHHPLLIAGFSLREGGERFLRDSASFVSCCFGLRGGKAATRDVVEREVPMERTRPVFVEDQVGGKVQLRECDN